MLPRVRVFTYSAFGSEPAVPAAPYTPAPLIISFCTMVTVVRRDEMPGDDLSRLLLDNLPDYAIFALDLQGRVLSWSVPAQQLFGYGEDEVIGQPAARLYTPDDVADGVPGQELHQAQNAGSVEADRWYLCKDGSRFWGSGVTTALRGADGALRGFAKVMRERTREKRSDDARSDALTYAQGIVETVREPLVILDERLRVQSANRAFYRTFQVAPEDTEDCLLYDLGSGQWDIPRLHRLLDSVLAADAAFDDFEVEHAFPGIGHKVMLLNARKLRREDTGSELILLAIEDVTERRRAEAERREIETRFTSLVKNIRDHSIFTLDPEGRVTSWNVAAEHILGYTEAEVLGRHFSFIFTPQDREQGLPAAELRAAREQGRAEDERWHLRKGGQRFWALGIVSALRDADGHLTGFAKILRDMTAWKEAQQAQRESEERFRALTMATSDAVYRMGPDWSEMLWLRGRDFIPDTDAPSDNWLDRYIPPDDQPHVRAVIDEAVRSKSKFELEHRVLRVDGSLGWALSRAVPLLDEDGQVVEWFGAASDITARKQAEESLLEANRRKDAFLATLGHELRNPLMPIRTSLDLIQALCEDAAACERPLQIMDRQLRHLVRLVDDLLDVSRISRGKIELRRERLDLSEIIDSAVEMSGNGIGRDDPRLTVSMAPGPLTVEGDRVRLVQVVSNLLNNAAKFTEEHGRITLRVMPRRDRVEIQVQDDGRGISRERLDEIFEPFAQAEPGRNGGLGIGLALVRSLLAMHGGTVAADSAGPGRGATFTISLPLCRDSAVQQPVAREERVPGAVPGCRVLVVDDNPDIAESLRLLLTAQNAKVRVAAGGAEALRICRSWRPALVLMDLSMPDMDGYEAARRLRASHPDRDFRLVAISGFGSEHDGRLARDAGFDRHLVKPVGIDELRALLAGLRAGAAPPPVPDDLPAPSGRETEPDNGYGDRA
jgi:PAS domain S-box-containing protein